MGGHRLERMEHSAVSYGHDGEDIGRRCRTRQVASVWRRWMPAALAELKDLSAIRTLRRHTTPSGPPRARREVLRRDARAREEPTVDRLVGRVRDGERDAGACRPPTAGHPFVPLPVGSDRDRVPTSTQRRQRSRPPGSSSSARRGTQASATAPSSRTPRETAWRSIAATRHTQYGPAALTWTSSASTTSASR